MTTTTTIAQQNSNYMTILILYSGFDPSEHVQNFLYQDKIESDVMDVSEDGAPTLAQLHPYTVIAVCCMQGSPHQEQLGLVLSEFVHRYPYRSVILFPFAWRQGGGVELYNFRHYMPFSLSLALYPGGSNSTCTVTDTHHPATSHILPMFTWNQSHLDAQLLDPSSRMLVQLQNGHGLAAERQTGNGGTVIGLNFLPFQTPDYSVLERVVVEVLFCKSAKYCYKLRFYTIFAHVAKPKQYSDVTFKFT